MYRGTSVALADSSNREHSLGVNIWRNRRVLNLDLKQPMNHYSVTAKRIPDGAVEDAIGEMSSGCWLVHGILSISHVHCDL